MRAAFEHPTVATLARVDRRRPALHRRPAARCRAARIVDPAPLSLMQQRVWYLEQLQLGRTVFNVPSAHRLRGALDEVAFGRAFDEMIRRHEALRTVIGTVGRFAGAARVPAVDVSLWPAEDLSGTAPR